MKRFLLSVAVFALTVSGAYAGPFGLFGRCKCQCSQSQCQPVQSTVVAVVEARPVATCVGGVCHAVGNFVESKPVLTFVKGGVSACQNGQCPKR